MNDKTLKNGIGEFDLIGDIHGYATTLKRLLTELGYAETGRGFQHPKRRVIFLGDFIDRGPEIRETLTIVKRMVDSGAARAVMGNHEFNALCYHEPKAGGGHLRKHQAKNDDQHSATLEQFKGHDREWQDYLGWFLTLPLWIEEPGLRVIHACWSEPHRRAIGRDRIDREFLIPASTKGTWENEAVEVLIKGVEFKLPAGCLRSDKDKHLRDTVRVKWWQRAHGRSYRDVAFPDGDGLPDIPVPDHEADKLVPYTDATPVFFGHYWMPEGLPKKPVAPNLACMDFSVAKKGSLAAYRWDGESTLSAEKFMTVRSSEG